MKFKAEEIGTLDGTKKKNVIVSTKNAPLSVIDCFLGIGCIAFGINYLMWASFKSGAKAHNVGEYEALTDLGIIHE